MTEDNKNANDNQDVDLITEIYQNEEMFNTAIMLLFIVGSIVGISIFLVGWLYFDRLGIALFAALMTWVVITLGGTMKLQSGKLAYDELVKEFQHDAEEMGIGEKQAQEMINTLAKTMDRVAQNSSR